ncbi:MAG TPA: thiamine biosynthesis protein ThiS [Gammaproteobacteria bacterium]|nr:thiamine biosynthesis protein ThiS [Gammaproteobacteria bacterium]
MATVAQIYINGESQQLESNVTLAHLLNELGLAGKRLAVELNQEIVPRSTYAEVVLEADDRIEIVQAIGGG